MVRMTFMVAVAAAGFALVRAGDAQTAAPRKDVTLLGTLAPWKYPGAEMPAGASMSDGGDPRLRSVKCQAVLTTPDPLEQVVDFYTKGEQAPAPHDPASNEAKTRAQASDVRVVSVQDDSQGRPVAVRVVVVTKPDSSTTLVISRAKDEGHTHIAWSHHLRLGTPG